MHRRQETPPSALWSQKEWDDYRAAPPVHVLPFAPVGDKIENAHKVLPMVANGKVRLVDTALSKPWLEQLMAFPASGHDDAVDATVSALNHFIYFDEPFMTEEELIACEYGPDDPRLSR